MSTHRMRQGAVGSVRLLRRRGRALVEKRMSDPHRHDTEVAALRALQNSALPVPRLVAVEPGAILMTLMPGHRLDDMHPEARLDALRASARLLRTLHAIPPPAALPAAPDDEAIVRRYREAGGPSLPFSVPARGTVVFCHGDWTDANVLAVDGEITAVIDWEAAHQGDPIRELCRAAWGAAQKDPRSFDALVEGYGADPSEVRAWMPIHAAELWLWFRRAGPPEYFDRLTVQLRDWPH